MRNRFIKGKQDSELSSFIVKDCGLSSYSSLARIIGMMYHVDTYKAETKWRPQGYVYAKDLVDLDITVTGEIATMDDEYIIFFTHHLPFTDAKILDQIKN